jgi:hypothetical protein
MVCVSRKLKMCDTSSGGSWIRDAAFEVIVREEDDGENVTRAKRDGKS